MIKAPLPPSAYERHKCGVVICQSPVDYFVVCNYCQLNIRFDDFQNHFRIEHYAQLMQLTQPQKGPTEDPLDVKDDKDEGKEENDFELVNHETLVDVQELKQEKDPEWDENDDNDNSFFKSNEESSDESVKPQAKEPARFVCDTCGKELKSKKGLWMHKHRVHKRAKVPDTSDSDDSSKSIDSDDKPLKPKKRMPNSSKPLNFECPHCEKKFPAQVNLFSHISVEHNPTQMQETVVRVTSEIVETKLEQAEEQLNQHDEKEHQQGQEQQENQEQWAGQKQIEGQEQIVGQAQEQESKEQLKETANPESVSSSSTKKPKKRLKYACELCSESFPRENMLTCHILSVHNNNSCDVCGKTYKSTNALIDHRNTHTGDKRFKCKDCDESFCSNGELSTHRQRHRPIKMCVCHVCGKECVKNAYQRHLRRHTGERPFKCRVCGKGFFEGFDRNVHESKHYDDKSFICDVCGGTFPHKKALRVHKKTHITERNVGCTICYKRFINEKGLKEHMRMHDSGRTLIKKETRRKVVKGLEGMTEIKDEF